MIKLLQVIFVVLFTNICLSSCKKEVAKESSHPIVGNWVFAEWEIVTYQENVLIGRSIGTNILKGHKRQFTSDGKASFFMEVPQPAPTPLGWRYGTYLVDGQEISMSLNKENFKIKYEMSSKKDTLKFVSQVEELWGTLKRLEVSRYCFVKE